MLGDGTKWIGNIFREVFGKTEERVAVVALLEYLRGHGERLHYAE